VDRVELDFHINQECIRLLLPYFHDTLVLEELRLMLPIDTLVQVPNILNLFHDFVKIAQADHKHEQVMSTHKKFKQEDYTSLTRRKKEYY